MYHSGGQQASCQGKHAYPTRGTAVKISTRRRQHEEPYRCHHCHGWHLSTGVTAWKPHAKPKARVKKATGGARGLLFAMTEEMA